MISATSSKICDAQARAKNLPPFFIRFSSTKALRLCYFLGHEGQHIHFSTATTSDLSAPEAAICHGGTVGDPCS